MQFLREFGEICGRPAFGGTVFCSWAQYCDWPTARQSESGKRGRALGFACTSCIHPLHVPIINEEYGVSDADADRARRLIVAFEEALAKGQGAAAFEGAMIDLPIVERARRLLMRVRKPTA